MKKYGVGILIAVIVLATLGALILPKYLARRGRSEQVFAAFDLMEAAVSANAGLLEYKHRLVEATAALSRMNEIQPGFGASDAGTELSSALDYFQRAPDYLGQKQTWNKPVLLELSEVELQPPDKSDPSLGPWASGDEVGLALLARAELHLENVRILSGRKSGVLKSQPRPRTEADYAGVMKAAAEREEAERNSAAAKAAKAASELRACRENGLKVEAAADGWVNVTTTERGLVVNDRLRAGESRFVNGSALYSVQMSDPKDFTFVFNGEKWTSHDSTSYFQCPR